MDADLSGKLNEILSDPDKLKTVMSAVSGIMGQSEKSPAEAPLQKAEQPPPTPSVPAFKSNERTELLRALKPFLSRDKCERIDKMLKIMTFAELAGVLSHENQKK
jgi:hypothetical protein